MILLKSYEENSPFRITEHARKSDYTGKVFFIFLKDINSNLFMEDILESYYYNVFFAVPIFTTDGPGFTVFETCAYCNNGLDRLNIVNIWDLKSGFHSAFELSDSFKGTFFTGNLTASFAPDKSGIYMEKN